MSIEVRGLPPQHRRILSIDSQTIIGAMGKTRLVSDQYRGEPGWLISINDSQWGPPTKLRFDRKRSSIGVTGRGITIELNGIEYMTTGEERELAGMGALIPAVSFYREKAGILAELIVRANAQVTHTIFERIGGEFNLVSKTTL